MPTRDVAAHTTAALIAMTPEHRKCQITSIEINNESSDRVTLELQDIFTPDESNGDSEPSEQTIVRWRGTIPPHNHAEIGEDKLKDVECLGAVYMDSDTIAAACECIVGYHFI
jgi:hypothetical protein